MSFFGFNKKKSTFTITDTDRKWVEDDFRWLIEVFGYPAKEQDQIIVDEQSFPATYSEKEVKVENIIEDLAHQLYLTDAKISYALHNDMRDLYGVPYTTVGELYHAGTEKINDHEYKIHLAKSITKNPSRLLFNLILECTRIPLFESSVKLESSDETEMFLFVASVFWGLGIPLTQNLNDQGKVNDGFWVSTWNYQSEMPTEVMIFALATHSSIIGQDDPEWKSQLSEGLQDQYDAAVKLIEESPSGLYNQAELNASSLFIQSQKEYENNEFDHAISSLQKVLFLTKDEKRKADAYNNIGYYLIRKGEFEKSTSYFHKTLELFPNYAYAYDNLGYALMQLGKFEEGLVQIQKAMEFPNNDDAYSNRNLALYYLANNNLEQAELHFKKAFELQTFPVDLLELHYAEFLLGQSQREKGIMYLKKAVDKGEPEAIRRMEVFEKESN